VARFDRWAIVLLALGAAVVGMMRWLQDHPQHNPWAPLEIDDPPGLATRFKLAQLREDPAECRAFLERSMIDYVALPPSGAGACRRDDRVQLASDRKNMVALRPSAAAATCAVQAGLALWVRQGVQPAARSHLGSTVRAIEHYGTENCRRIGGGESGRWSQHATANAIDIAGFVLSDGRRITVRKGWKSSPETAAFLHQIREAACGPFTTVLSPDYNAAHADHFHFDQAARGSGWTVCR